METVLEQNEESSLDVKWDKISELKESLEIRYGRIDGPHIEQVGYDEVLAIYHIDDGASEEMDVTVLGVLDEEDPELKDRHRIGLENRYGEVNEEDPEEYFDTGPYWA